MKRILITAFVGLLGTSLSAQQGIVVKGIATDACTGFSISGADVTAAGYQARSPDQSDNAGRFDIPLRAEIKAGSLIRLKIEKRGYVTWDRKVPASDEDVVQAVLNRRTPCPRCDARHPCPPPPPLPRFARLLISVYAYGKPMTGAKVQILDGGATILDGETNADGKTKIISIDASKKGNPRLTIAPSAGNCERYDSPIPRPPFHRLESLTSQRIDLTCLALQISCPSPKYVPLDATIHITAKYGSGPYSPSLSPPALGGVSIETADPRKTSGENGQDYQIKLSGAAPGKPLAFTAIICDSQDPEQCARCPLTLDVRLTIDKPGFPLEPEGRGDYFSRIESCLGPNYALVDSGGNARLDCPNCGVYDPRVRKHVTIVQNVINKELYRPQFFDTTIDGKNPDPRQLCDWLNHSWKDIYKSFEEGGPK
jgi:hypothetical protein